MAAEDHGWISVPALTGTAALELLAPDIRAVILDLGLPGIDGLQTLQLIHEKRPGIPVVMLTGTNNAETAVKAIKAGASDYLTKPFEIQRLFEVIRKSTEACGDNLDVSTSRKPSQKICLETLSPRMKQFYRQVEKVASLESTILLTGESGSGKTYIARKIHELSHRSEGNLITVNCPSVPDELLDSELFGHEKGAFEGATAPHIGRFEEANSGTIFLDEIAGISKDLQAKLLNVLQDREFFRLGGKAPVKTNARIIASTHVDLQAKVDSGEFREDLFYRLNTIELTLPPLRERREDIPKLISNILRKIAKNRETEMWKLTGPAVTALKEFDWPGNIRQLESVLEQSTAFAYSSNIEAEDIVTLLESPLFNNETPDFCGTRIDSARNRTGSLHSDLYSHREKQG